MDDMAYVNGDPAQAMRPWAAMPRDEWARLEARVRRHVPVRDDFVTIAFPRLASVSPRQIAGAVESYKREAAIVDARLTREVTLQCKGIALSDLCDHLRGDTGIELSAGPSVADEKVTVFCDKTRLRDVMRQLSRAFGYTWLRSGRQGAYKYELEQDMRSQLLEEELRNRDRDAALLALDARMQQFRPFLGLSFEELKKRWDAIPEEKKRQPWERLDDGSGVGQMWELVAGDWGAVQLYHRLTPRDRDALMAGEELVFRPDAPNPERRLPAGWDRQLLVSMNVTTNVNGRPVPIAAAPGAQFDELRLGAHRTELGQVTLKVGLWASDGSSQPGRGPRWGVIQQVATAHSPTAANPDNAVANSALRNHPPFEQVVSLHPTPSCPVVKEEPADKYLLSADDVTIDFDPSQPHATSADVWEAIHRATGLPIVADYYTHLYPLRTVTVDHEPLFEALCTVGDALDVRWRQDGGFLVGRSARFFWDRLEEVPDRYLQRWAQDREASGGLPLADFLEMASLSEPQLDAGAVAQGIERGWGLREWAWARSPAGRLHARCLALLTPDQLRRAQAPGGLPFKDLSPAQQQAVMRLEYEGDEAFAGTEAAPPVLRSPEEFARAAITACYVPAGWYVAQVPLGSGNNPSWTGPWHYAGGRTEAEALAAARQRYPGSAPLKVSRARDGFFNAGM